MIRHLTKFHTALLFATLALCGPAPARPANILFILADDLGQRDLGCYGSTFYETPNLDKLAAEGARFTDAYAACPVCSPTRAGILTGLWPQRTGVTDYIGAPMKPDQWKRNTRSLPAPCGDRLPLESTTIAEVLKQQGYPTFFAGKWHLGPEGYFPENQGFDINMGGCDLGGPYTGNKYFSPYNNPRLTNGPDGEHLTDRLASETIRFIEANKDRPFFAYLSFYDVHTPLMAREDLRKKYEAKRKQLGLKEQWGREEPRDVRLSQDHAVYAAMVEAMDQAVGKVITRLDELGLAENTIVIFTSDNGGLSTSEGWPTSNAPLRGGKGWIYEGGIREPLIIRWPAKAKPGALIHSPAISTDFFPTLLDAAETPAESRPKTDGTSLLPHLTGKKSAERPLFWHYPHYGNQGGAPCSAIRLGDWKLIEWLEDGKTELYNLTNDIGERIDKSREEPGRTGEMLEALRHWRKEVGATYPTKNTNYNPSAPDGRGAKRKTSP